MIFDINSIKNTFGNISGVLHVGAFCGEELNQYRSIGLINTILFEPQKHIYEILSKNLLPTEQAYNVGLGDEECELDLYLSSRNGGIAFGSGGSSSFLKPKIHLTEHPEVSFNGVERCKIKTLDNIIKENKIDIEQYNFLNVDVQGYELKVLKGAINTLKYVKFIIAEVNRAEVYENCPMIEEIDLFLKEFGFINHYTYWQSQSWGDALYVKQ